MASRTQIDANRVNAKKSTGPKTVEGKAAASQNAFKHGLFVKRAVVRDESQQEYDRHREALSAEYKPVGETESIVAERLVNLTWRLERAQRMQNQSVDYLGIEELRKYRADFFAERYQMATGVSMQEAGVPADHLLLGRLAAIDWFNCRVLDRMMMYERRIENSMYKALSELRRLQKMRKAGQTRAGWRQSPEKSPQVRRHKTVLKKQSQFAPTHRNVNSFPKGDCDDGLSRKPARNEANQSEREGRPAGAEVGKACVGALCDHC
jgi:hypothetical protein